jgi:hypothetical protein
MRFGTNLGVEAMRIDSAGNVGIGVSPATRLDVASTGEVVSTVRTTSTSGARQATLRLNVPSTGGDDPAGRVQFTYGTGYTVAGSIEMSHTNNNMKFLTGTTERMRIDASGRQLIGNTVSVGTAFQTNLQVTGVSGSASNYAGLGVISTNNEMLGVVGTWSSSENSLMIAADPDNLRPSSSVVFTTDGTERARISGGDLLVGTTSASGTSGQGIKLRKVSTDGVLHIVGATSIISQDAIQVYSTGASAYRFFVQYNGQVNATFSSINAISDASLKENIRDLDKGLETILALQPRRFDWKNGDGNDIMGFVAQEVETVLPELVHDYKYSDEETKLGLKMGDMIPSLVKAIQEQQETITALTARIEQLENN